MHAVAFVGAGAVLLAATGMAAILSRSFGGSPGSGRFATIDGLRGYLALCVFLHHSAVWYFYINGGIWQVTPSNLFTLFGEGGVALFFMITAFLFFGRLLDARHKELDWSRLYISRVLRLTPLYLFAITLLFVVVGFRSDWTVRDSLPDLLKRGFTWVAFTIRGEPDLNGVKDTWITVAGVTWSLPYEWFFYLSLPILGILTGVRPSRAYLLVGLAATMLVAERVWTPGLAQAACFGGGMAAALAVRLPVFRAFAATPIASVLAIGCAIALVMTYPTAYAPGAIVLLSMIFILIAGGSTLFGALTTKPSRLLGDIAYSLYMLHGIVLFVLFRGPLGDAHLSSWLHWAIIVGLTPVLVILCFVTFRLIEKPAMDSVPRWVARLRSRRTAGLEDDNTQSVPLS